MTYKEDRTMLIIPMLKPKEDIAAPAGTNSIFLQLAVTTVRPSTIESTTHHPVISLPYTDTLKEEQQIEFPVAANKNHLVIVAARLRYSETETAT